MSYDHIWREGTGTPLVLFHGTGSSKEDIVSLADHIAPGAPVLAMDGDVLEGPMRRFFKRTGEGVYDMGDLARATAKMAGWLDEAFATYGIRDAVGVGYSNGANILANMVLTGQGPIRRSVWLHPLIPFAWEADLAGHEILVTAGQRDPICPWPQTEALIAQLRASGAAVETALHPGGHELRMEEVEAAKGFLGVKAAA